ncbi:MAG: hypothetical protein ACYSYU_11230 [Planctomycetota bacterium]|jgi:hypothetical protein
MMAKPEIVLEIKTYADGVLVAETAKVVKSGPNWTRRIVLGIGISFGLWIMTMQGMF